MKSFLRDLLLAVIGVISGVGIHHACTRVAVCCPACACENRACCPPCQEADGGAGKKDCCRGK